MSCHDCLVEEGMIHKFGCDMERCPFCGHQLISCYCVYKKLGIDCSEGTYVYAHGLSENQNNRWLNILVVKGRVPYIVYPNICFRCGKLWPEMFHVSNEEWNKYIQLVRRGEMLCQSCFDIIKQLIDTAMKRVEPSQNINNEPITVKHADLERIGDSMYKSVCPVCSDGILLVNRDQNTLEITDNDRCISCGQSFIYSDLPLIRNT